MKFNHLVEINDPLNPLIDQLTRKQLWQGLVLRAEAPKLFVPHLDQCDLLARSADTLSRALRYGTLVVRDSVTFFPMQRIHYQVPAQQDIPASTLTMSIEEPQTSVFFIRFEYDDGKGESEDNADAFYNEFRRSAYEESDIDTVRIIRQLAEEGRLDAPPA